MFADLISNFFSSVFLSFSCLFFQLTIVIPRKDAFIATNSSFIYSYLHITWHWFRQRLIRQKRLLLPLEKQKENQSTFSRKLKTAIIYWLKIRIYPFISRDPIGDYSNIYTHVYDFDMYLVCVWWPIDMFVYLCPMWKQYDYISIYAYIYRCIVEFLCESVTMFLIWMFSAGNTKLPAN